MLEKQRGIIPRVTKKLVLSKCIPNIANAIEAQPVRNAAVGHRALETVGVAHYPVRHKTTIAAPSHAKALFIHPG